MSISRCVVLNTILYNIAYTFYIVAKMSHAPQDIEIIS